MMIVRDCQDMTHRRKSKEWIRKRIRDPYLLKARESGLRTRSAFKLLEILDSHSLLRPGSSVLELGAAPGGWSQVLLERVGPTGRVVAVDLVEMEPLAGLRFVRGDLTEADTLEQLSQNLGSQPLDLLVSDMAPKLSGVASMDQARAMHLADLCLTLAVAYLKSEGALLLKVFQGEDFPGFLARMRQQFKRVEIIKPAASLSKSKEVYLLGLALNRPKT